MNTIDEELASILEYIETQKPNHPYIPEIKTYVEEMRLSRNKREAQEPCHGFH
jgi:hypothetical protein